MRTPRSLAPRMPIPKSARNGTASIEQPPLDVVHHDLGIGDDPIQWRRIGRRDAKFHGTIHQEP